MADFKDGIPIMYQLFCIMLVYIFIVIDFSTRFARSK